MDVVALVPPLAIGNGVPEYVIAIVPDVVIGTPDTDSKDGTVAFTLVTVPVLLVYPLGLLAGYAPKLVNAAIDVVALVPPFAIPSVPASVTVPEVVTGPPDVVKPVVPPDTLTDVTVPVLFVYPLGLLAGYAPKLVNAPIAVVELVPPLAIGNGVPEYVIAIVPDVVIGTPDTDSNEGTVAFTLVTVPVLVVYPLGLDAGYAPKLVSAPIAVVALVPPLAIPSVPSSVTVPLDAELGVNPVEPALNDVTVVAEPN
jgi:hypothetical protein